MAVIISPNFTQGGETEKQSADVQHTEPERREGVWVEAAF